MKLVFDVESDGLLDTITTIWLICAYDLTSGKYYSWRPDQTDEWKEYFDAATLLVGHNIYGFDIPAIEKILNYKITINEKAIIDTLLMSQILDYYRFDTEGHSLDRWGLFLGFPKGDFKDFSKYSTEMRDYCLRDVQLSTKIYHSLLEELKPLVERSPKLKTYLKAEHYAAEWVSQANLHGWPFKKEEAINLLEEMDGRLQDAYDALNSKLGMKCVAVDKVKGVVNPKKPKWTKTGFYDAHTARWFDIDPASGLDLEEFNSTPFHRMIKGEYSRVIFENLKLTSVDDMKVFLFRNGWEPTDWNYKRLEDGTRSKSSPKITEDSLEFLGGDGKLYVDFLSISARHSILKKWVESVDENSLLRGQCFLIGTPSMRATHKIIANVPSIDAMYGAEIRKLFTVKEGWTFIGTDSAGNQARGLAHFLGDPEYIDILLNGDIHTYNAEKATIALKEMGITFKVERSPSKRIFYATLFGASGGKLWSYIFGTVDEAKGKKFKKLFLKSIPGFQALIEKLENIFGKTSQYSKGYVPSLVGNKIYCDSFHKLLVYLLQSTEKITCSAAIMITMQKLYAEKIPYQPLIYYHDEIDYMTPPEYAEKAAAISAKAFKEGPELLGITIMDGNSKIGKDWCECH